MENKQTAEETMGIIFSLPGWNSDMAECISIFLYFLVDVSLFFIWVNKHLEICRTCGTWNCWIITYAAPTNAAITCEKLQLLEKGWRHRRRTWKGFGPALKIGIVAAVSVTKTTNYDLLRMKYRLPSLQLCYLRCECSERNNFSNNL